MGDKKGKHPNCPKCTKGLKLYREACYAYWAASQYHIEKLHRLYRREGNKFIAIGWHCKRCGFVLIEKNHIQKFAGNQEIIIYNFILEIKKKV